MDTALAYFSAAHLAAAGTVFIDLLGALVVGLLLGYERSYHGHAAGMRTYVLVCLATTLLTAINAHPDLWFGGLEATPTTADPTRTIQGLMTGIGFLGAGVIMKEGLSIRGLATAASIWTTAAIGVTIGVGFYGTAIGATAITLAVMSGFHRLEAALPHQRQYFLMLSYARPNAPRPEAIRTQMKEHGFAVIDWSFHGDDTAGRFSYELILQTTRADGTGKLVDALARSDAVLEFKLSPTRS